MQFEVQIRNYRPFGSQPVTIRFQPGFSAFIGPNNSGKSSVFRFFQDFRPVFSILADVVQLRSAILNGISTSGPTIQLGSVHHRYNEQALEFTVKSTGEGLRFQVACTLPRGSTVLDVKLLINEEVCSIDDIKGPKAVFARGKTIDVSPLIDSLSQLTKTLYVPAPRQVAGSASTRYSVGKPFVDSWNNRKNGPSPTESEQVHDVTERLRQLFGFQTLEINQSSDGGTFSLNVNGKSFQLADLGGGFEHFLVALANASFQEVSFLLIDEPEAGLHPKMQVEFLRAIGRFATRGVLFGTHSIGLARAVASQTYALQRTGAQTLLSEYNKTTGLSDFASSMGFSNLLEVGLRAICLVEGVSDTMVFQELFRSRGFEHHVLIVPLGGGQLINGCRSTARQLLELKRLGSEIFCVIDSEKTHEDAELSRDRAAFVALCEKLKIRCFVLKRRAIENYWTDRAIKAVKGEKYQALLPYAILRELSVAWAKDENWRIAAEMRPEEIECTDLIEVLRAIEAL